MKFFEDKSGRRWTIVLNIGVLRRIKSALDIDLLSDPQGIPGEVNKLVDILWITLEKQINERCLTVDQFCELLESDVLAKAVDALMGEYADFFSSLSPAKGSLIRNAWEQNQKLDSEIKQMVEKVFGNLSIVSPDLLASAQTS